MLDLRHRHLFQHCRCIIVIDLQRLCDGHVLRFRRERLLKLCFGYLSAERGFVWLLELLCRDLRRGRGKWLHILQCRNSSAERGGDSLLQLPRWVLFGRRYHCVC